ncbi:MAG: tetratricopeptide repeat-containing glycosyltransferase family protein [Opitutus sp.]|nr:tetratricopeptide repeat-containing glycosyltransferase family protein [Opitutus sp.]
MGLRCQNLRSSRGSASRLWFGGDKLRLNQAVGVYETMQELHRTQENVTIACDASVPADVVELYETLPRMNVVRAASAADLAICSRTQASGELSKSAARVWCWDAGASELPVLAKHLQASGLALQAGAHALFARGDVATVASAAEDLPELLKRAAERLAQEDFTAAASLAERAVKMDNKNVTAYGLLGRGFRGMQLFDGAAVAFKLASHLEPKNAEWKCELGLTLREAGKLEEAIATFQTAVRLDSRHDASWFALGKALFAAKRYDAAADAFQRAHTLAPTDPQPLLWHGHAMKRQGRLLEALQLHQRAVGGSGDVSAPPPGVRRRVMFVVQHGPFWPSMASVYRAFAADPSWDVTVVALPYNHPYYVKEEEREAVFAFLKKEGIPYVHWSDVRLQPGCADVVFLQNPYDVSRPEGWRTHEIMRSVPRIAYIPYALEIHGGTENATMHVNLTLQQLAWAVFARSRRHRATFTELCETGDAHVAVTGHPKMDSVRDLASVRDEELERFIAGRKMVFWNPQFDVRLDSSAFGKGYSTFLRWQEFLPAEFARRQDLAFVIRPHPLFFATLEQRKILTAEQIAAFLERCAAAGNILVDRRSSYLPVFAAASALITDASSFLLEYAVTGRPLLYLHNPNGPGLNADGAFVHEHCATATTEAEIAAFLDDVTSGRDPKAESRRAAVKDYMHLPPEGVATAIKRTIEERLSAEFVALRQRRAGRLAEDSSGFLMNHSARSSGLAEQSMVRKRSALVLGGAGHGNLGDEALLLSAVQCTSSAIPGCQIVVATPDETVTQKTLGDIPAMLVPAPRRCLFRIDQDDEYWKAGEVFVERWTQLRTFLVAGSQAETLASLRAGRGPRFVDLAETLRLLSAIGDADVVVLHGGGILTSATRSRLWDCALIATLCEHWGKKLLLRSHQIGPIEGDEDTQRLREILGASVKVTTRDRNSLEVARAIGATTLSIAERPDDAFFAKIPVPDAAQSLRAYGLERGSYIGVCYRMHPGVGVRDAFMEEFADVCRKAAESFTLPLVLVPMMPGDVAPLHALCERLRGDATVIEGGERVWERVMLIQNARLVVSLPHHPLIFALRGGVPVISPVDGDYYRHKNVGSMGLFGCEDDVIMHSGDSALFHATVRERLLWLRTNEAEVRRRSAAIGQQLDKEHFAAEAWFWTEGPAAISPERDNHELQSAEQLVQGPAVRATSRLRTTVTSQASAA